MSADTLLTRGNPGMDGAKRLLTLKRIRLEKIERSRSWIFAEISAGRFPKPLALGGGGPNLWLEEEVDRYVADFIAAAKARAAKGEDLSGKRAAVATAARLKKQRDDRGAAR